MYVYIYRHTHIHTDGTVVLPEPEMDAANKGGKTGSADWKVQGRRRGGRGASKGWSKKI